MEFGMPTLIEAAELDACAALCRQLGLEFIELNMNMPQYQLDVFDEAYAAEIAAKHGIYYTLHLDGNLNVCDFNPYVAKAYTRTVLESIALAKRLRMPVLNMHLHDALGKKNHLALGTGEMDIEKYLRQAQEQNCREVLETKTIEGLKASVRWVRDRYR